MLNLDKKVRKKPPWHVQQNLLDTSNKTYLLCDFLGKESIIFFLIADNIMVNPQFATKIGVFVLNKKKRQDLSVCLSKNNVKKIFLFRCLFGFCCTGEGQIFADMAAKKHFFYQRLPYYGTGKPQKKFVLIGPANPLPPSYVDTGIFFSSSNIFFNYLKKLLKNFKNWKVSTSYWARGGGIFCCWKFNFWKKLQPPLQCKTNKNHI